MRYLVTMPQESVARKFGDYLLTLGIDHQLEDGEKGWDLWVADEDDLERAQAELGAFNHNPDDAKYARATREADTIRAGQRKKTKRLQSNYVDVRTKWAAGSFHRGFSITLILMGLAILVTLVAQAGNNASEQVVNALRIAPLSSPQAIRGEQDVIRILNLQDAWPFIRNSDIGHLMQLRWAGLADIRHGQVWRLVTPIFIHFGFLHILFNMWWLWDLGRMIESRKGSWKLLGIVALSGIAGNLVQYYWSGPNFGGMSGVVYGLFGYVWIKGRLRPHEGMAMQPIIIWFMLGWLVACMTGMLGPVANGAHLFGLVSGVAVAGLPPLWLKLRRAARRRTDG